MNVMLQHGDLRIEVDGRTRLSEHLPTDSLRDLGQGQIALGDEVHGGLPWRGLSFIPLGFLVVLARNPPVRPVLASLLTAGLAVALAAGKFLFDGRHTAVLNIVMEAAGGLLGVAGLATSARQTQRGPAAQLKEVQVRGVAWEANTPELRITSAIGCFTSGGGRPRTALRLALQHSWPAVAVSLPPVAVLLIADRLGAALRTAAAAGTGQADPAVE